jgi:adenylyl- and sulfurtransferase ThiI
LINGAGPVSTFGKELGPARPIHIINHPPIPPYTHSHTNQNNQAKKKEAHQKKKKGQSTDRHNPRAFSVANVRRTQKNVQRNLDRAQRCVFVHVCVYVRISLFCDGRGK